MVNYVVSDGCVDRAVISEVQNNSVTRTICEVLGRIVRLTQFACRP